MYKITTHHAREHTHLAYKLEIPAHLGKVQARASKAAGSILLDTEFDVSF